MNGSGWEWEERLLWKGKAVGREAERMAVTRQGEGGPGGGGEAVVLRLL